ncbi:hypothetical protein T190607A01A_10614 [Tenacibaculum sp. 190524A05c]|uniref:Uncharacterized protein n=1 Tax=Tenacibaculum platacis TaxID=3137852 RepID=A0ABM9NT26_9FLAO
MEQIGFEPISSVLQTDALTNFAIVPFLGDFGARTLFFSSTMRRFTS